MNIPFSKRQPVDTWHPTLATKKEWKQGLNLSRTSRTKHGKKGSCSCSWWWWDGGHRHYHYDRIPDVVVVVVVGLVAVLFYFVILDYTLVLILWEWNRLKDLVRVVFADKRRKRKPALVPLSLFSFWFQLALLPLPQTAISPVSAPPCPASRPTDRRIFNASSCRHKEALH